MKGFFTWDVVPLETGAPTQGNLLITWRNAIMVIFIMIIVSGISSLAAWGITSSAEKKESMMAGYGKMSWDLGDVRATTAKDVPPGVSDVIRVSPV